MKHKQSEWWDEMIRGLGHSRQVPKAITAAVISKPYLVLVTLRCGATTSVDAQGSRVLELGDRSAGALAALSAQIVSLSKRRCIDNLYLRAHSANGKYVGHALNFKIEAAAQLSGMRVTFVHTHSVGSWVKREEPYLPDLPLLDRGCRVAKLQLQALETALFVSEHYGEERYFSDGADSDG